MDRLFAKAVMKVVAAQVCKDIGFQSISEGACEALAEITQKYVEEIGKTSHLSSEKASRTESNFNDVRQALKELNVTLDDLRTFASLADSSPFPKEIPEFPVRKPQVENSSSDGIAEIPPHPSYVPDYLPAFPKAHSFVNTPVYEERIADPRELRKEKNREKKELEGSLAKLNDKLGIQPIANYDSARKVKSNVPLNPYLQPPKSKESERSKPTPLQKDLVSKIVGKSSTETQRDSEEGKRVYSEVEESERAKKRSSAEQILALGYKEDLIDMELPRVSSSNSGIT